MNQLPKFGPTLLLVSLRAAKRRSNLPPKEQYGCVSRRIASSPRGSQ